MIVQKYNSNLYNRDEVEKVVLDNHIIESLLEDFINIHLLESDLVTEDICLDAVKKDGLVLQYIPEKYRTNEVIVSAIKQNPKSIVFLQYNKYSRYTKLAIELDNSLIRIINQDNTRLVADILRQNGLLIQHINPYADNINYLNKIAVKQNGLALEYVHNKTEDICLTAVKQNGLAIKYVPEDIMTKEIANSAIKQNPRIVLNKDIFNINSIMSYTYLDLAVSEEPEIVVNIDSDYKFIFRIWNKALKQNGLLIKHIDHNYKHINYLNKIAVKQNGLALEYVHNKTEDICLTAVKQNGLAIKYVPEDIII